MEATPQALLLSIYRTRLALATFDIFVNDPAFGNLSYSERASSCVYSSQVCYEHLSQSKNRLA
jgi:hypothetical protein